MLVSPLNSARILFMPSTSVVVRYVAGRANILADRAGCLLVGTNDV